MTTHYEEELIGDDAEGPNKKRSNSSPLSIALRFLTTRDRSELEVRTRLKERSVGADEIEDVILKLKELSYLDDRRFARSWTDLRIRTKQWGLTKIASELHGKGVPSEYIDEALGEVAIEVQDDAAALAIEKWVKVKGHPLPLDDYTRSKALNFLSSRGFTASVAFKAVKELDDDKAV